MTSLALSLLGVSLYASSASTNDILFYDIRHLSRPRNVAECTAAYCDLHALVCLQGIVNRDRPRLAIRFMTDKQWAIDRGYDDLDGWWLHELRRRKLLPEAYRQRIRPVDGSRAPVPALVGRFRREVRGLVVWDPEVPATFHLATTLSGAMDLVPVPAGEGPGQRLTEALTEAGFKVVIDLAALDFGDTSRVPDCETASTGSAKCNVYAYMMEQLIEPSRVDTRYLGYYVDAWPVMQTDHKDLELHTTGLVNCDYLVQRRGVLFDLSPWGDEASFDEPDQPVGVELRTLHRLLEACRKQHPDELLKLHGFLPWSYKYTTHLGRGKHEVVPTEWESIDLFSRYGVTTAESDAAALGDMPNGSFYSHASPRGPAPLNDKRNEPPPLPKVEDKVYICWWMGDYDSSAWLYSVGPGMFADRARGDLPLAWGINPTIFERSPHLLRWLQEIRSPRDYFVAYEGPGYIDANQVPDLDVLAATGRALYDRYNYTITGCVINKRFWLKPEAASAYATFSPGGVAMHPPGHHTGRREVVDGMPMTHIAFHTNVFESDAERIADLIRRHHKPPPDYMMIRCILVTPTTVQRVMRQLGDDFVAIDPYTFFGLVKRSVAERG